MELSSLSATIERMARNLGNPNTQGPFGNTLLHSAVASGDIREVRRLLKAGADPRIVNRQGQTPLRVAVLVGRADIYQMLAQPYRERLLDEALMETFPASDPVAVSATLPSRLQP
jgi:ankyrin repeat protein